MPRIEHRASADRFLAALGSDDPAAADASMGLVGVPYDGAVTYRSGARRGPAGIRAASDSIETYCPRLDRDLASVAFVDHGDLAVPAGDAGGDAFVQQVQAQLPKLPRKLLALGGDHLIAYPFVARALAHHPGLQLLHIDAHTDLRDTWEGERFNHATVIRRVLDDMPATARLWQWGIRSGLRQELTLQREDPRILAVDHELPAAMQVARHLAGGTAPIYITLDVDGIDPSEMPGTGTPEPGGLRFRDVETVLGILARGRAPVVGADLVEVAPPLDPTGITDVAGARLARTLLLTLAASMD